MKTIKYVVLDLNRTLTSNEGSWIEFTGLLGADPTRHVDIFNNFREGKVTYSEAKKQLLDLWKNTNDLDRKSIISVFNQIELREGVIEGISYLKSKYTLCLISGAIDVFVNIIADRFKIEDRYAVTKFIFDQDNYLVDFEYTLNREVEKMKFLNVFCNKYNALPEEIAAIGDGESDMKIFQEVGYPILFLAEETSTKSQQEIRTHLSSWVNIENVL